MTAADQDQRSDRHAEHPREEVRGSGPLSPSNLSKPDNHRRRLHDCPDAVIPAAVFGYHLQQPSGGPATPAAVLFCAVRGRPDEALLRQLCTVAAGVEPRSRCQVSAQAGVTDLVAVAARVILEVRRLSWIDAAAVEVVGGCYVTPWQATALRYRVECAGERWVVTAASEL